MESPFWTYMCSTHKLLQVPAVVPGGAILPFLAEVDPPPQAPEVART